MAARWLVVVMTVAACGHLGFDAKSAGDATAPGADASGATDASDDASALRCMPGTTCRAAVGACDMPATCASDETCPPNALAFAGTSCSSTSVCNGSDARCPTWQAEASGTALELHGAFISGTTAFVDGNNGFIAQRAADGSWTTQTSGTTRQLWFIWAADASDAWAVGLFATLQHWDGTSWKGTTPPTTSDLYDVWGTGPADVWAVGGGGAIIHWDGTAWSAIANADSSTLYAVAGTARDDVWFVGAGGTILHWDGTTVSSMSSPTPHVINSIVALTANDAWAVGGSGAVMHWNGTAWSAVNAGSNATLNDVAPVSATDVWVFGDAGTMLHYDGTSWASASATSQALYGAWPDGAGNLLVAGAGGTILHLEP
jgi:hypothetical protein